MNRRTALTALCAAPAASLPALAATEETPIGRLYARLSALYPEYDRLIDENGEVFEAARAAGNEDASGIAEDHNETVGPVRDNVTDLEDRIMNQDCVTLRDVAIKVHLLIRCDGFWEDEHAKVMEADALRLLN
ncbi:hypothetical protein [Ruegeria sp. HKCCD8929]|uniref:hypothetical protein n=1 Tax=Ruegeria sp. HKCCD8929 TaxID=2683006 RepID=UPI001488F741|nr:hypothetical protein [Ruegeria sp. HKCCD8929]